MYVYNFYNLLIYFLLHCYSLYRDDLRSRGNTFMSILEQGCAREAIIQYIGELLIQRIISLKKKSAESHCVRSRKYCR